jgi:hypothetical protein
VDLVIVADAPDAYRNTGWLKAAIAQRAVLGARSEPFGNVWSLFVALAEGPEIEFTFAERSWVKTDPPAAEVCRILCDGVLILHDPHRDLVTLCSACGARSRQWGQGG